MRGMFVLVGINYPPKDEFTLPDSLRNMANDPYMFLGAPPCPGTKTFLIDDKEALSAIRSYRKDLRAGLTLHPVNHPAIYVRNDDDTLLMFFVRDSIPLENDRGFIDFNLTPGPNSAPNTGEPCR